MCVRYFVEISILVFYECADETLKNQIIKKKSRCLSSIPKLVLMMSFSVCLTVSLSEYIVRSFILQIILSTSLQSLIEYSSDYF